MEDKRQQHNDDDDDDRSPISLLCVVCVNDDNKKMFARAGWRENTHFLKKRDAAGLCESSLEVCRDEVSKDDIYIVHTLLKVELYAK